jgi:hypothetical protein
MRITLMPDNRVDICWRFLMLSIPSCWLGARLFLLPAGVRLEARVPRSPLGRLKSSSAHCTQQTPPLWWSHCKPLGWCRPAICRRRHRICKALYSKGLRSPAPLAQRIDVILHLWHTHTLNVPLPADIGNAIYWCALWPRGAGGIWKGLWVKSRHIHTPLAVNTCTRRENSWWDGWNFSDVAHIILFCGWWPFKFLNRILFGDGKICYKYLKIGQSISTREALLN